MGKNGIIFLVAITVANIGISHPVKAQEMDTVSAHLALSAYAEVYYSYDFNKPTDHMRQPFFYTYNRHNEISLNLGYIKAAYSSKTVRANLALMVGTYADHNLAAESNTMQHVYEASVGIKLSKSRELWLDAGVLPSHIGFESAVGKDCWTLTRSLQADNSPYFETGVRLSYGSVNGKWHMAALVLNGWQRIARVDGNNTPAFGHQLTFKPNDKITLNSSSFIGNDKPDSVRAMRYFHDFYAQFQLSSRFALTAGFDIGAEQKAKGSSAFSSWYSPALVARYTPNSKWAIAGRVERYRDKYGVVVVQNVAGGTDIYGYSLNVDYAINSHAVWRIEGRQLHSPENAFEKSGGLVKNNFFITSSLAVSF